MDKVLISQVRYKNTIPDNENFHNPKCLCLETQKNSEEITRLSNEQNCIPNKINKILDRSTNKNQENILYDYDENEHIYETIPEDSESEPLYCSPYQSSNYMTAVGSCSPATIMEPAGIETDVLVTSMQQQTQRVAQWLGLKSQCSKPLKNPNGHTPTKPDQPPDCNRIFTLRSTITSTSRSSSSGNVYSLNRPKKIPSAEVRTSPSAYNTAGTNNSATPHMNIWNANDDTNLNSKLEGIDPEVDSTVSQSATFVTSPLNSMLLLPFGKSGRIGLCSGNLHRAYISGMSTN